MAEYGKRSSPVVNKALSPEALERWRDRARQVLSNDNVAPEADAPAPQPHTPQNVEAMAGAPETVVDMSQRRRTVRQKTLIGGKVVSADLMSVYDCTVRDLSESGARVKLNAPVDITQVFTLRLSNGQMHRCKIRRRMGLELGVEFVD